MVASFPGSPHRHRDLYTYTHVCTTAYLSRALPAAICHALRRENSPGLKTGQAGDSRRKATFRTASLETWGH